VQLLRGAQKLQGRRAVSETALIGLGGAAIIDRDVARASDPPRAKRGSAEKVLKISEDLLSTLEMPALLEKILDGAVELVRAERGIVVLRREREVEFGAAVSRNGRGVDRPVVDWSQSVLRSVLQSEKPIDSLEGCPDPGPPSKARPKSILAVPLVIRNSVVGALYLDHTRREDAFEDVDRGALNKLCCYSAIAIENARRYDETLRDSMTGLYSHRYFETCLAREIDKAARSHRPQTLLLIDVDHLDVINEAHGTAEGDRLLGRVAAAIRAALQPQDVGARSGGDEFEVLLPDADKAFGVHAAQRILRALDEPAGGVKASVSVGVASFPQDARDIRELVRKAEEALHAAKRQGRGRVEGAESRPGRRDEAVEPLLRSRDVLSVIRMMGRLLEFVGDPQKLLENSLELLVEATRAESGLVALASEEPRIIASRGSISPASISRTILTRALQEPRAILVDDAASDARFRGSETVTELRSVLAGGILVGDKPLAAIYLENRSVMSCFTEEDRQLVEAFARKLAPGLLHSLDYASALSRIESLKTSLSQNLAELGFKYSYDQIVGRSRAMLRLLQEIDAVIESDYPVIVEGETGTGKELVAKVVHFNSKRREMPFIAENCGAIARSLMESELFGHRKGAFTGAASDRKGLFSMAHGGTLFLDEIEEMPEEMQVKLLRAIENREIRPVGSDRSIAVDVRVVCSSNREMGKLVEQGKFREDLFYRLRVFHLRVPPLRERREDIPLLVRHFLARVAAESNQPERTVAPDLLDSFGRYSWPGNVRELENEIRRLCAASPGEVITAEAWRPMSAAAAPSGTTLARPLIEIEREAIVEALRVCGGSRARAAQTLGLSVRALFYKLKQYGIR
jgi:diguanylate cyclase (GGDEF)-like protein